MNRSIDPTFDQRIADWLEDDPTTAPREVLATVIAAYPSIPQRRAWRMPWRFPTMNRIAIPLGAALVVVIGAVLIAPRLINQVGNPTPIPSTTSAPTPAPTATARRVDYSDLGGRILVEHLGNAIDRSEMPTTEYHPERRRLYFMDPATMSRDEAVEFLPGQPPTGKLSADVSADGSKVVFMDTADDAQVWIANLDGTGLRKLSEPCGCSELDPAFDPTGTKIVFVHLEGGRRLSKNGANFGLEPDGPMTSWLGIRDIATGTVTILEGTRSVSTDAIPEQPAWSPDGTTIVFNRTTWGETEAEPTGVLQLADVASGTVTELPLPGLVPGDADWSPDGSRILFTDFPISAMGSTGLAGNLYTVAPDGTSLKDLKIGAGGSWIPDGKILFQSNNLWVMLGDGTQAHQVKSSSDDLTELEFGFVYISHWIPPS